ncbi:MAG: KH domain-containing protein [Candidatus Marsarchaeota archaeon]|jgi:ribosomal RNA assembly protein|nr:KH domain-containing protein [Candidatus Marsarchaeota archaeon]
MQEVYITEEKVRQIKAQKATFNSLQTQFNCKIDIVDKNTIRINADNAFNEYILKDVIFAFGRGFDLATARKLIEDGEFFSIIDLGSIFKKKKQIYRIKARIIGKNGKTKLYIESVSGVKISIYGDTVAFIGTENGIHEAETAVNLIIKGKNHKTAYKHMEATHRKNNIQEKLNSIMK